MNNFTPSNECYALVKESEGCVLDAYPDPASGGDPWTIGYGHTKGVKKGDSITEAEADTFLAEDMKGVAEGINRDCTVKLTQHEFDALVDFAFNLGLPALEHSTLWRKVLAGDFVGADTEFPKWDMAAGKHMLGLRRRRLAEQGLFMEPDDA